jgi:hypothetical protein
LNENKKEEKMIKEKSSSDEEDSGAEEEEEEEEMTVDNNEVNNPNEDQNLQETLARVKIEEQIMRVEEIVTLYKVNNLIENHLFDVNFFD